MRLINFKNIIKLMLGVLLVDLVNKKLKNERLFPLLIKINKKLVNGQGFANKKILKILRILNWIKVNI